MFICVHAKTCFRVIMRGITQKGQSRAKEMQRQTSWKAKISSLAGYQKKNCSQNNCNAEQSQQGWVKYLALVMW